MDRLNEIAEKCLDSILSMDGKIPLFQGAALMAIKAAMVQYSKEQSSQTPVAPPSLCDIVSDNIKSWKELQFKVFMDRYGKKVGRAVALKKWMKLNKAEIERILDTVLDFVAAHPDPQFRPNPLTYLNQRRWEDEIQNKTHHNVKIEAGQKNTWTY
jgi:hypothetical protein